MRSRLGRILACGILGYCMQIPGCSSEEIDNILTTNITNTAVEITSYVVEAAMDDLFNVD